VQSNDWKEEQKQIYWHSYLQMALPIFKENIHNNHYNNNNEDHRKMTVNFVFSD